MSKNLPNMLENTIAKIREMVDSNSVVGEPIVTQDGVTIIPISKISVGLGGGGSDFVSKNVNRQENPFGGGVGAGVKVTPVAFLIIKEGNVRMLPVATPAPRKEVYSHQQSHLQFLLHGNHPSASGAGGTGGGNRQSSHLPHFQLP